MHRIGTHVAVFIGVVPWLIFSVAFSASVEEMNLGLKVEGLNSSSHLELALSVEPGNHLGQPADWWLVNYNQQGWSHFDLSSGTFLPGIVPSYTGPLFSSGDLKLSIPLSSPGLNQIYFGVDLLPDGNLTLDTGLLAYVGATVTLPNGWWRPAPGVSWQWQLSGVLDGEVAVDMYDIDLFNVSADQIIQLRAAGRKAICYFSAGSWEDWRDDAGQFPAEVIGKPMDGWPDERWLDIRNLHVLGPLITARLDLAVAKGCDGVEPDNVDGYQNESGFSLSADDQLSFNRWLATQAHLRGLSVGLKNDLAQIRELVTYFDWALNEQCFEMGECNALLPFIDAGKAVFGVEYNREPDQFCAKANAMNFDWLRKNLELDAWVQSCR